MKKSILAIAFFLFSFSSFSQNWSPVGQGLNKFVTYLLTDTNTNYLYAGGYFDSSGTTQVNHIAYWDGIDWNAIGSGFNDVVKTIIFCNGEIFAAGQFTMSGTSPLNYIAKWNGTDWISVGTGFNDIVLTLFDFHGTLVAGGNFTMADGQPCKYIAQWDGLTWSSLDTNIVSTYQPLSVTSIGSYQNELIIGGNFIANGTAHNIAVLRNGTLV